MVPKSLFEKKGYIINWKSLKNQDLSETIIEITN